MNVKNNIIEILILTASIILLIYSCDPVIYNDSSRYLEGNLKDPPLYSIIITIMQSIFKSLNSVIVLQTFVMSFGIIFFTNTLSIIFSLNTLNKLIVAIFLYLPTLKFYNHLLTEPFSNAFSLLFVSFIIRLICNFNFQNLIWSSVFTISLLLMRNQFILLYPLILLLYLCIFIVHTKKNTFTFLAISLFSILIVHNSLSTLNKYLKQDTFKNKTILNSETGVFNFLYIDAIYISSVKDVQLFENLNSKKTLTKIFALVNNDKALMEHYDGRGHFSKSYQIIRDKSPSLLKDLAVQENTNIINLKKEISLKLIRANFKNYAKHIFKKFYDSSWLFIFVPFFMLIASFINFLKYKSNFSIIVMFLSSFSLANHSVIYLFGRVQPRYFIYSDFILLVFIFISFSILIIKNKKIKL
jgi:hypothetical protein